MYSLVANQVRDLTKSLITALKFAFIGFLLVVYSRMLLQRGVLSECLVTLGAIEIKGVSEYLGLIENLLIAENKP